MKNRKGITILEILVVLSILGFTAIMVLPSFTIVGYMEWRRWTRHLVSDLRWAQQQSILGKQRHYIELDMEKNRYLVYVKDEGETVQYLKIREIQHPVTLSGMTIEPNRFHFAPSGAPSRGNTIDLAWRGRTARIITRVGTGRIRVALE